MHELETAGTAKRQQTIKYEVVENSTQSKHRTRPTPAQICKDLRASEWPSPWDGAVELLISDFNQRVATSRACRKVEASKACPVRQGRRWTELAVESAGARLRASAACQGQSRTKSSESRVEQVVVEGQRAPDTRTTIMVSDRLCLRLQQPLELTPKLLQANAPLSTAIKNRSTLRQIEVFKDKLRRRSVPLPPSMTAAAAFSVIHS